MASPNYTGGDSDERKEGFDNEADSIHLNLKEDDVAEIIGRRVERGVSFWNSKLGLDKVRKNNEKRWLNKNLEVGGESLYDFQVPYKDNRIFVSVETLASNLVKRVPVPIITNAFDTDASRELAYNYGKVLEKKAEELYLKQKLQMVARHLLMGYRVGVQKYWWDVNGGRLKDDGTYSGSPMVQTIRPHKIVIDAEADDPYDVPLIAHSMRSSVEELGHKFPDKKDEILKKAGLVKKVDTYRLGKKLDYYEVWFTYYDEKTGARREGVAWKIKDLVLDFDDNPNFNYKDDEGTNFFSRPYKPFVLYNFLRTGKYAMDDTSLTEQAAELQDVLEKRGRQIVENADRANSTKVFNTTMIDAKDAQKYVEDPGQTILIRGDVRAGFARVPPPTFQRYVIEDKFDARREIDNIFGTHAPLRGEKTDSPTLGQELMSQQSDLGRVEALNDEINRGAAHLYGGITQLYKVYGEEEHMVKYTGEAGRTTFIKFSQDKIEDGIEINIQAGSSMPNDKASDKRDAIELSKLGGRIDPLTFAEKWHLPNPQEFAKRLIYFTWMPDKYMTEVLDMGGSGGEGTDKARQTIQRINAGENVPPIENPTKEYIAAYDSFLKSPEFKQLDPEVQRLHIAHIRGTQENAKKGLEGGGGKPPKPPEPGGNVPVPGQEGDVESRGGLRKIAAKLFGRT